MSKITHVFAREILDSRGNPTVEVDVLTEKGHLGRASVPSGASTGLHEALELRDGGKRYGGKGVSQSVLFVNKEINSSIKGQDVCQQKDIDKILLALDGTENKSTLGANTLLGVSWAISKAAALEKNMPLFQSLGGLGAVTLPVPLMNILNGGAHANNGVDVQEFMICPIVGDCFSESLRAGVEVFQTLKKLLDQKGYSIAVGDEGGFAPRLTKNEEALEMIAESVDRAGYVPGEDIYFALDVASTEFFKKEYYSFEGKKLCAEELGNIYKKWCDKFPIVSIEDGFAEDDWSAWIDFTKVIGGRVQLVGDDLFVTNPKRIQQGIEKNAANALLVKCNQIGTLTETQRAVEMAHGAGFKTVMSHRSGETEDAIIADLSVGLGCTQIKTGSLCRGERTAKYNQLLRIEEILGDQAQYLGKKAFQVALN